MSKRTFYIYDSYIFLVIERAWKDAQEGRITETGVMVHRVIEEVDAGTVLGSQTVPIDSTADLATLEAAIHKAEHSLLVHVVGTLCTDLSRGHPF